MILVILGLLVAAFIGGEVFHSRGPAIGNVPPLATAHLTRTKMPSHTAVPTATVPVMPTATPTPSPTLIVQWLQVLPTSISLACHGPQKNRTVILYNSGPDAVGWFLSPSSPAGVNVDPHQGQLGSGGSMTITIHNKTHEDSQQGTILFVPGDSAGGQPASLSYTAEGCG